MGSLELFTLCFLVFVLMAMTAIFASAIRIVPEDKRLMVYRLGRLIGEKGPGLVLIIPLIDRGVVKEFTDRAPGGDGGAESLRVQHMFGRRAETATSVFRDGGQVILANGERVDAISDTAIPAGKSVRVKRVIVEVESME
jgi:regulator of protease activity HflC (stomatin/prohibitin superfamily)